MHTSEETLAIETVARRRGKTPEEIRLIVQDFAAIGYRLEKQLTHAEVCLPEVRGIPSVLEGDR